jgi:hypothetical protein
MIFFDTETCGLHGPIVLLQYAIDDGPVILHEVWREPIAATLNVIERIINDSDGVVGFNLAFDMFHLCQLYTVLSRLPDLSAFPEDLIEEYALEEPLGRDGPCLKPRRACDLMLHARKGPYQSTMDRKSVRIRRIPTALASALAEELEQRIPLKDIYFARRKDKRTKKWRVVDIEGTNDFKNLELKFAASSALKALCADAFNRSPDARLLYHQIEPNREFNPKEKGYAPFALAVGKPGNWKWAWPDVIWHHINHWGFSTPAREYAAADVTDTRDLYKFFGSPELGDDDSELACLVGACRWRGYAVDTEGLKTARTEARMLQKAAPRAPNNVRRYLYQVMDPIEQLGMGKSTKKTELEKIAKWRKECDACDGTGIVRERRRYSLVDSTGDVVPSPDVSMDSECLSCHGARSFEHPAAVRAQKVLAARRAQKEIELYTKIIEAGRFHASFKVIGTLSSRMSGADGLNPQAINKRKEIREHFKLAHPGMLLCGGDFKGFEVSLAEAVYSPYADGESKLRKDLLSGKKVHALFGQFIFPEMTYDEIVASDGAADDKYTRSKSGFFAVIYGGNEHTLMNRLGVELEAAEKGYAMFVKEYPEVGRARQATMGKFCSMRQPIPYGRVEWHEPAEYVETKLGFRRYFTLENKICKALFELAQRTPPEWRDIKVKVVRRERIQSAHGAVSSALYGAAFAIQGSNMRAAVNHEIQGWGAGITKRVQRKIWDLQPPGINPWHVQPMNIHDEIECPALPEVTGEVEKVVKETVESFRPTVPLIGIGWKTGLENWASK